MAAPRWICSLISTSADARPRGPRIAPLAVVSIDHLDRRGTKPYSGAVRCTNTGTPGESRGRKATGPRLLRDAGLKDATKDPTTAELPKAGSALVVRA
jgi:hypothetical protein